MPTYAYRCPKCGHQFEKFHKMNLRKRPACPECGATADRMITGGAGLVFKGSGFYITDYKRDAKPREKEAGEKAKGAGKPDAAKPEPKKTKSKPPSKHTGD